MNDDLYKLQYEDPYSLLVITSHGNIKKLFCPFPVVCVKEILGIKTGETVIVTGIATDSLQIRELRRDIIIFVINQHNFYYWFFQVI